MLKRNIFNYFDASPTVQTCLDIWVIMLIYQYKNLERKQWVAAKWVKGHRDHYYEDKHKELKLHSLDKEG